ncbi:MAG: hypothetical protein AAGH65_08780, partial [Pseudomonadota bacterium]
VLPEATIQPWLPKGLKPKLTIPFCKALQVLILARRGLNPRLSCETLAGELDCSTQQIRAVVDSGP